MGRQLATSKNQDKIFGLEEVALRQNYGASIPE